MNKQDLKHGKYYEGSCRNASIARWNAEKQRFYHWRTKWGYDYIESICCPEDDKFFDVFYAERELQDEEVTKEINW